MKNAIPDYSDTLRSDIPKELQWKIEDLYKSKEEWLKDKKEITKKILEIDNFKIGWLDSSKNLKNFLKFSSELEIKITNLYIYANLLSDTELDNSEYQAMKGEAYSIYIELSSKLSFFDPEVLAKNEKDLKSFFKDDDMKAYEIIFDKILRRKNHILSQELEELISQTYSFSDVPEKVSSILNDVEIPAVKISLSDGKEVELNYVNYVMNRDSKNREDRLIVMTEFWKNHQKFKNSHAALLDSGIKQHWFNAKAHKYDSCLSASLYPKGIDTKVYTNMIKTVKEHLEPLHKYLKLKERLLNLDKITYSDIYASSVSDVEKKYTIDEAKKMVIESTKILGKNYTDALKEGFKNSWMDIYPNKSKRSGAYSNGSFYKGHPYVLMNYQGRYNDVSTLSHEFGHALHSDFSNKNNPHLTSDYPIFLAEIASTFNETLLVDYVLKKEEDQLFKLYILDQNLESLRATIFRQTLFAEFELLMHQEIESGKTLTFDWLDSKYLELTREYYGHDKGIMEVEKYIENEWSLIPHFYYNFYVYQYSTGIMAAMSLVEMVQENSENREKYLNFLKAGGSDYPLNILKKAGVDLTSPEPILKALNKFSSIVDEMEKIAKELGMIKK